MEQEQQLTPEMKDLAKSIRGCKQCLEQKDFDGLSDQLGKMGQQLGDLQEELKDLDDIEEHLQNLKQMKKEGCKECEGQGKEKGESGHKDDAQGYAEGATGRRPENKDAQTRAGEEQRARGFPGRSAEELGAENEARLAEDAERDRELDAARREATSARP